MSGFQASRAQRAKGSKHGLSCGGLGTDPAHIIPRSLGGCDHEDCVIPLCRAHHRAYDEHKLDVLPLLTKDEQAHAVGHVGLIGALQQDDERPVGPGLGGSMTTAQKRQQAKHALALANEIRLAKARLRAEISSLSHGDGCEKVAQLLREPSGPVLSFRIGQLILSITKIGETGMPKYLRHAGIFSSTKYVRSLTPRQRNALADALVNRSDIFPYWNGREL